MRNFSTTHQLSLVGFALVLATSACGGDDQQEGADAGTADESGETTADGPEGSSMEGDGDGDGGDGDGDAGDGDGDAGDGDGDAGDGDGDAGDGDGDGGDGDGDGGDGDGEPSGCADHETQEDCEADPACQAVNGQPLLENGPDAPCLEPTEFIGCIEMMICDDALTWFCVGGNAKPVLMSSGCGPEGAEMCDPMIPDPPECP
jgi:hypothetical protein